MIFALENFGSMWVMGTSLSGYIIPKLFSWRNNTVVSETEIRDGKKRLFVIFYKLLTFIICWIGASLVTNVVYDGTIGDLKLILAEKDKEIKTLKG